MRISGEAGLPAIVIVGRPNVGKSTLFNAILGRRRSIVGDEPGMTRDRIHGVASHRGRAFELIDTGGIIPNDADLIPSEILKQARIALEQSAHIVFVIDGRAEITAADRELAHMLRKLGKPVAVVVNKIDAPSREALAHEFFEFGFPDVFAVSAEHRLGLHELLDHVTASFESCEAAEMPQEIPSIRVAIVGRPNAGKSSLLNALVGAERSIVSPVAGTTRDAVDETIETDGARFVFVDTAGIRRKGKTKLLAEKLSVVMARKHIQSAHVVMLVLDASEGITGLDATIGGYAHEEGRALILCANKWDAAAKNKKDFTAEVRGELKFLEYAPLAFISAKTGYGVQHLFGMIRQAYDSASKRVTTGELNRFVELLPFGRDMKVYYITQGSVRPPTFVLFTDKAKDLHFSTERYLVNQLRKRFGFEATPVVIKARRR